jgi:ATP-dependent exoDNAse (exonuclease V) beta subunit
MTRLWRIRTDFVPTMKGNIPISDLNAGQEVWLTVAVISVREIRPQQGRPFLLASARNASERSLVEGNVDLAFVAEGEPVAWTVVDFKTDFEIEGRLEEYRNQVTLYIQAIARATSLSVRGVFLRL